MKQSSNIGFGWNSFKLQDYRKNLDSCCGAPLQMTLIAFWVVNFIFTRLDPLTGLRPFCLRVQVETSYKKVPQYSCLYSKPTTWSSNTPFTLVTPSRTTSLCSFFTITTTTTIYTHSHRNLFSVTLPPPIQNKLLRSVLEHDR
jgi:hypothetical protein